MGSNRKFLLTVNETKLYLKLKEIEIPPRLITYTEFMIKHLMSRIGEHICPVWTYLNHFRISSISFKFQSLNFENCKEEFVG